MPLATKLGRVGIYKEELPSLKSLDPLIRWSYKVMGKMRSVVSLLPQLTYGRHSWQGGDLL